MWVGVTGVTGVISKLNLKSDFKLSNIERVAITIVPKLPMFELLKFEHSYKLPQFKLRQPLFERAVPKFASNYTLPPYST